MVAAVIAVVFGYGCNTAATDARQAEAIASYLSIVSDVFLRLIKMIIAPLVFATLAAGIAHVRGGSLGRIGLRTMLWFVAAGLVSIMLGIVMVQALDPGAGSSLPLPEASQTALQASDFDLRRFIVHLVPTSIFDALARNEILQVVVFAIFAGVALAAIGPEAAPLVRGIDALASLMLRITDYIMRVSPIAVFAAIAAAVSTQGLTILVTYGEFIGGFYLALLVLWTVLGIAGYLVIGKQILTLFWSIREPVLLAFSTASSEAAYPKTLARLTDLGVPKSIVSFVLPLGYSFNLDGSMMYCAFALMFIAKAYGVEPTLSQQVTMLLLLMVTSKGVAGVPRASLVVIAASLPHINLPEAGILLVLGIDQFLDMGRTATNVVGNSVATAVVAKWEGASVAAQTKP